jgi:glycine/serine hydroxymethyltransferase
LNSRSVAVEGDAKDGFTETHQVLIRVSKYGHGEDIARRLEDNNIITNYQALPDDDSFLESSGIRMGVQEMTRFGMKEADFEQLAEYLSECVISNKSVRDKVSQLRQRFLTMHYCLPEKESLSLAARVLASILPADGYLNKFADNLKSLI